MKHIKKEETLKAADVAPCAGAWIETCRQRCRRLSRQVAPCAGAWIETGCAPPCAAAIPRRPLRGGVD